MKIAIGSKNPAKVNPTKKVLLSLFPDAEIIDVDVNSNVSEMPLNDEEMIKGAINRAKNSLEQTNADMGIGLEGGAYDSKHGMFLAGWVAIVNNNSKMGLGSGPRMLLPEEVRKALLNGEELGPYLEKKYPEVGPIRKKNGAFGLFSKDLVTRPENFDIAVRCALAPFITEFYHNNNDNQN